MIMERKIGEIFEYNGEWYQCVVAIDGCRECSFRAQDYCTRHSECLSDERSDGISVIFKKLEKVGEPYELNSHLVQKYRFFHNPAIQVNGICILETINTDKIIEIGIKQTKKDMEDLDKIKVRDYTKVEELNVMEENKLNLKPFDIQKAREGKPVCTRDGRKARIICFDSNGGRPIVALVTECDDEEEIPYKYHCDGSYNCQSIPSDNDLMMLPEKKEGWVNVYKERIYSTKEEAIEATYDGVTYVDTVKVCWEE